MPKAENRLGVNFTFAEGKIIALETSDGIQLRSASFKEPGAIRMYIQLCGASFASHEYVVAFSHAFNEGMTPVWRENVGTHFLVPTVMFDSSNLVKFVTYGD